MRASLQPFRSAVFLPVDSAEVLDIFRLMSDTADQRGEGLALGQYYGVSPRGARRITDTRSVAEAFSGT